MKGERCTLGCQVCERRCSAGQAQTHRFDCCGVIRAHVPVVKDGEYRWLRSGMEAGYLTGLSQTKAEVT